MLLRPEADEHSVHNFHGGGSVHGGGFLCLPGRCARRRWRGHGQHGLESNIHWAFGGWRAAAVGDKRALDSLHLFLDFVIDSTTG